MESRPVTADEADAVRHELEQLDRSWEPDGPNGLIALLRIRRLLDDVATSMVIGRDRRRRALGLGPIDDEEIQLLVDAAADLEAMTPRRGEPDE